MSFDALGLIHLSIEPFPLIVILKIFEAIFVERRSRLRTHDPVETAKKAQEEAKL